MESAGPALDAPRLERRQGALAPGSAVDRQRRPGPKKAISSCYGLYLPELEETTWLRFSGTVARLARSRRGSSRGARRIWSPLARGSSWSWCETTPPGTRARRRSGGGLFLPSYSPELQPSERLWPLSDEAVANRRFEEIGDPEEALVERCVSLSGRPQIIRSYIRYHWWPNVA